MPFGALRGSFSETAATFDASWVINGSAITVMKGDLMVVILAGVDDPVVTQVSSSDLGAQTWTAQNSGTENRTAWGKLYYALAPIDGTISSVTASAASPTATEAIAIVAVFEGPFLAIDKNPANTTGSSTPFSCPATGTLTKNTEFILNWCSWGDATSWTVNSGGGVINVQAANTVISALLCSQRVQTTTTVTQSFNTSSVDCVGGTATFTPNFAANIGTLSATGTSIPNPVSITGSVYVEVGDLVVVGCAEILSVTAGTATDNLGHTYTALSAGIDGGSPTFRGYYAQVQTPGTLTSVSVTATSSTDDYAFGACVYKGPFIVTPLDVNLETTTADISSPFSCQATGTLASSQEVAVGFSAMTNGATNWVAGTDYSTGLNVASGTGANSIGLAICNRATTASTTTTPSFTGTAPTDDVFATATFRYGIPTSFRGISQLIPTFRRPFPVVNQIFSAQPFPQAATPVVETPQGWMWQSPDLFTKPFPVGSQQVTAFAPAGDLTSTPQGWYGQSPDLFTKPYPAPYQQFQGFAPADTIVSYTPQGWWGQSPDLFTKPFPVTGQKFDGFAAQGEIVSYTPQGWYGQSPDLFQKPVPVGYQQFAGFAPLGTITYEVTYITYVQSPDLFGKPYPVVNQQFQGFAPADTIVSYTPQGWMWQSPDLFTKPYPVTSQPFQGFVPAGTIVSYTPQGWWGQSPDLFTKPFPVASQQFAGFAPLGEVPYIIYYVFSQAPDLFTKPYPVTQQPFQGFVPAGTIVSYTPQGWWGQSPDLFTKPFPVVNQQTSALQSSRFITAPIGWLNQSPAIFRQPVPVTLQQFGQAWINEPVEYTLTFTPSPPRFTKPVPVQFQKFDGYPAQGNVPSPVTPHGWMFQSPVQFTKLASPAIVSMFASEILTIVVSRTATPRTFSYISSSYIQ